MLVSTVPEKFRNYLSDSQLVADLLQSGVPRASSVIVPWAVVLLDDPSISASRLAEIISYDPRLSSRALSFANSPRTLMASIVTTVDEALMRLGLLQVRGFVLAETLPYLNSSDPDPKLRQKEEESWRRAIMRAMIAREIATSNRYANTDEMYTCALVISDIERRSALLSENLSKKIQANGFDPHAFVSVVVGLSENWPSEWIQAAVEQSSDLDLESRGKLGEVVHLSNRCIEILLDETPFLFSENPEVAELAQPMGISENVIQRVLSSSRKKVKTCFKHFGI